MAEFFESVPFAVIILLAGFVFLVKGADLFVAGSSSVAKRLKVPSIIIGLTIVAMGTSLPETAVSVSASLAGNNTLAISNAIGSNIFNIVTVIGFCSVMTPVIVQKETLKRDIPFSIFCAVLLLIFGFIGKSLGRLDSLVLIILFVIFLLVMVRTALQSRNNAVESEQETKMISIPKSILFICVGAAGIALGGDWVVDGAGKVAAALGMSQTLVGLTIVSIGTSLPELVTSIVAARKKEVDMALGNAIGSNIFNILMVLGIAGVISPMAFNTENMIDILVLVAVSILVWIFARTRNTIGRAEGVIMLLVYASFMGYIIVR